MILGPSGENIYPEGIESIINESDWVLESLVYEQHGQLIARVHLNYEKIDEEFRKRNTSNTQIAKEIETILANLRNEVNSRVSSFSRLQRIIEQPEPFEKTPTQKIKRYLYTQ
jgi:long-chain acyl-CoA synthetase